MKAWDRSSEAVLGQARALGHNAVADRAAPERPLCVFVVTFILAPCKRRGSWKAVAARGSGTCVLLPSCGRGAALTCPWQPDILLCASVSRLRASNPSSARRVECGVRDFADCTCTPPLHRRANCGGSVRASCMTVASQSHDVCREVPRAESAWRELDAGEVRGVGGDNDEINKFA